jgi:hypothetical protein
MNDIFSAELPLLAAEVRVAMSRVMAAWSRSETSRRSLALTRIGSDGFAVDRHQIIYDKAGYADIAPAADGGVHVFFERDDFEALSVITLTKEEIEI